MKSSWFFYCEGTDCKCNCHGEEYLFPCQTCRPHKRIELVYDETEENHKMKTIQTMVGLEEV